MNRFILSVAKVTFSIVFLFAVSGCRQAKTAPVVESKSEETKILLLGDSRVHGNRPDFESYRYELWKKLIADKQKVDFIGSIEDESSYPKFMGKTFDKDHAGVGGFTTQDILDNLEEALAEMEKPDVVLLGIGGNDLMSRNPVEDVIENINKIIDILQAENNQITIFVEQIAPGRSKFMTPEVTKVFKSFNSKIPTLATKQTTTKSKIIAVDMASDWSDSYLADDVHYNEKGAKVVAERYFAAIKQTLKNKNNSSK